jgi:hypothetical protein
MMIAAMITLLATGCTKSELTSYDQPDMIYIYKDAFNTKKDSATCSFAIKSNSLTADTVKISVRIMGVATNTDRVVKLAPVTTLSTAIEGTHYEFLPYVIKAGQYNADLPVVIKRTTDMKTQEFRLVVQVVESTAFIPGVPNSPVSGNFAGASLEYLIKMNDFLTKPSNWDTQLTSYFGTYSQVKFKFIIDNTGKTEFPLGAPPALSIGEIQYYKAFVKSKLIDYVALNGPLLDEFGQVVTFP